MKYTLAAFADEAASSLSGQIQAMLDNHISYLEIRGVDGENIADLSIEKAKEVRQQLSEAGLSVWSLGSPYGKINITDDFEPHLESFYHGLELAGILGAKHIRLFSFYCPADKPEHYSDEVMRRLECFISAAKGTDLILCHENEKGIYGDIASRCAEIHQNFPELKAVFDPANFVQCGQDTLEAWEKLSPYVEYMHIKDALADGSVVPAGKGMGNLPYLLSQYSGDVLTIEPHLSVFEGFSALENTDTAKKKSYCYSNSREAFDAAVHALCELVS